MQKKQIIILTLIFALGLMAGCGTKKINRDYIPVLKKNLYSLQLAVRDQNLAQIDSLLSLQVLEKKQSSDSLIRFVYGYDSEFEFVQFGNAEIVYTNNNARIDCYVMDSSSNHDRPIVFFLEYEHDLWLFTSFGEKSQVDSLRLD